MKKGKVARLAGFIGALGVSTVLVTMAVQGTGAYFTDSQSGTMSGSTGHISIAANSDTSLSFDKLIPGDYQTDNVSYTVSGDTNVDTWLYFPDGAAYCEFTGAKDDSNCPDDLDHPGQYVGGMGRYGHFAVADNGNTTLFSSYNLANAPTGVSGQSCDIDEYGHGSGRQATSATDTPAYCGVPHYIKLESNLSSGTQRTVHLTFGVTGRQTQQGQAAPPRTVPFQIVATQVGIAPDAANF